MLEQPANPVRIWCIETFGKRSTWLLVWTLRRTRSEAWKAFRDKCIDEDQFRRARECHRAVRVTVTPESVR